MTRRPWRMSQCPNMTLTMRNLTAFLLMRRYKLTSPVSCCNYAKLITLSRLLQIAKQIVKTHDLIRISSRGCCAGTRPGGWRPPGV